MSLRGSWEAVNPPPLRLTNFSQLRFFGQQKKFWQSQFLFVLFSLKETFINFKVKLGVVKPVQFLCGL